MAKNIINGIDYTNYDKLYKEYEDNWRSIFLSDMQQADKFIEYLKLIGHVPANNIRQRWAKDLSNNPVVHVCEPLYTKTN